MKTITERNTEIITDLIKINNDRIAGYTKAAKEISETDNELKLLFEDMAAQSQQFAQELRKWIDPIDYEPLNSTTISGRIYRVWMDVKATFSGHTRQAVLENCEFGEDAAQKAYRAALASDAEMSADVRQLITDQQSSLKTAHDLIKKYRDAHKAANN